MKVLVIADVESKSLWDYYSPKKLEGVDLIISCGDLNSNFLQFLVTLSGRPLLYVRGNHDERYEKNPPDGCICIENMIYNHRGMRIAGLGGSMRYKNGPDMYSEMDDLPHRGFDCFNEFLMKFRPFCLLHGHVHRSYNYQFERKRSHPSGSIIINAYESYILEIPDTEYPEFGKTGSILYDRYCGIMEKFRWFGRNPF